MRGSRLEQHVRCVQRIRYRRRSLRPSANLDDGRVLIWLFAQGISFHIRSLALRLDEADASLR